MIVASDRAAAGVYRDTSGPILVAGLRDLGFLVADPVVVPDGEPVTAALRAAVAEAVAVALTSGGTGIAPTDRTPRPPGPSWTTRSPASPRRCGPTAR